MGIPSNSQRYPDKLFINASILQDIGLSIDMIRGGINYTYTILDIIDQTLLTNNSFRLSQMMELANLSTFIGNLLAAGIANESSNTFIRNGPHKYPDLLANSEFSQNIEIKIALENNKPKGHLAKSGYYMTCRYILGNMDGTTIFKQRGEVVWIWEIRCGFLEESDFNTSNTENDSGKTAVINKSGMSKLQVIYLDIERAPLSPNGKTIKEYRLLYPNNLELS